MVDAVTKKAAEVGKGKGTYATAAVLVVAGVLVALGKVSPEALGITETQIEGGLGVMIGIGMAFLRRAIAGAAGGTEPAK
jgi:hypothetical protein